MAEATATARIRVERDPAGQVVVYLPGRDEPVQNARVARCFPWSFPHAYISMRGGDGKEIAFLKSLDELDPSSRAVVERELRDHVFNPRIRRVLNVKHEFGVTTIEAETDRGNVSFQVRSRDDVRLLSPTRALFRDADGNAYEVPDINALDRAGRKALEQYF